MNFEELMAMAAAKQEAKKAESTAIKRYNTAIPPPKKEVKRKGISPNVQAFLAKKEEEAKKKAEAQKQFREKYLEKSKKCYRKVQNIHELIKEENEKEEILKPEPEHVKPTSDKTASNANSLAITAIQDLKPSKKDDKKDVKAKKKGNAPSFAELMKMAAEQKKNNDTSKSKSGVRPMTAKEKEELERSAAYKKTKEYRIWAEYGPAALERYKEQQRLKNGIKSEDDGKDGAKLEKDSAKPGDSAKSGKDSAKPSSDGAKSQGVKRNSNGIVKKSESVSKSNSSPSQTNRKSRPGPEPAPKYASTNENILVCRPAQEESPWERLYGRAHGHPVHSKAPGRGMVIDSDEDEEEDDLEGFIDDGPLDDPYGNDVSSQIRAIFGYDKRKYRDEDEDVSNMESSFCQQMKEEQRSARIGLQEDLEDIRREEEEMKRKMAARKKMRR